MKIGNKILTGVAAASLIVTLGGTPVQAAPAVASAPATVSAPRIGGGYMPNPPKSAGLCAFVLFWMPFDLISRKKYCGW